MSNKKKGRDVELYNIIYNLDKEKELGVRRLW